MEESIQKQEINDTDQSSDNEDSCWNKTKSCLYNPIKYYRDMTSVKSDDHSFVVTEESCWSKTKKYLCNPIESCCGKTMECVCAPFKSCLQMIKPCVSYVWDPVSDFFDYYANHFAMLKFILTNVALSLFDVGSDINTAITFLM